MKTEIIADELFIRVADKTLPAAQALAESRRMVLERENVIRGLETSLDDAKAEHRRALLEGEDADRQHVEELAQRLDAARDTLTDARRQAIRIPSTSPTPNAALPRSRPPTPKPWTG